ncbi:MAG TPA: hypothetical protein VM347_27970 [Nonomuraea sp.]|nr:hypothetical protein [Nonomuraea sp.]
MVPDRRGQAPAVDFGGDLFRCGQVKRKRLFYKKGEIARKNILFRVTVRERRHADIDRVQTAGVQKVGMAPVSGTAVPLGQSPGSSGICVGDSRDRHIGETGQHVRVTSGDISGTDDADTSSGGEHSPAYPTFTRNETNMFEEALTGQMSPT